MDPIETLKTKFADQVLNVGTHASRVSKQELETRFLPVLLEASKELSTRLFH